MLKLWKRLAVTGLALLLPLMAAVPAGAAGAPETIHIVALGDSITAGYEPGITDVNAKPYGYPERLLEQAWFHGSRATLANYGLLGLTTSGLRNYVSALKNGGPITAETIQPGLADPRLSSFAAVSSQTASDLREADVIAITIGGNDVSSLLLEADKMPEAELQGRIDTLLQAYSDNMTVVLSDLRTLNPGATVIVADQYQPAPKIGLGQAYPKLMTAAARFTEAVDRLVSAQNRQDAPVLAAHVAARFAGVEGSLTHIVSNRDFHPTQLGYEAIASVFAEALWGGYKVPSVFQQPSASPRPMTIVVKGTELNTPNKPIIRSGQNFLPLRDILNAVGANGTWDNKTSSASVLYQGRKVVISIGSKTMLVNGQKVALDTPAFLHKSGKEDKTYLPLAALAEGLGFDVQYSPNLRTAFINP